MELFGREVNSSCRTLAALHRVFLINICMLDNPSVIFEWVLGRNPALGAPFSARVPLIKSPSKALYHQISLPWCPGRLLQTHTLTLTGAEHITLSRLSVFMCVPQHVPPDHSVEREGCKWVPQVTVYNGGVWDVNHTGGIRDGEGSGLLQGSEVCVFNRFNDDSGVNCSCNVTP